MRQKLCELCFVRLPKLVVDGVCFKCVEMLEEIAKKTKRGSRSSKRKKKYCCKVCGKIIAGFNRYWCSICAKQSEVKISRRYVGEDQ